MSFGEAVSTCLTKYADFTGRARRSEYWWFYPFVVFVQIPFYFINPVGYLVALAFLVPTLAAGVRRLHDTGRSGWYYFIILIPLIGAILLIVWTASEGNLGPNQYGDPV